MRNQSFNKVLGWVAPVRGNKDEAPSSSESVRVRRSTRVPLAVSVTISSSDQSGPGFKENTGTIDVSKHGARILTLRALKPGATIEIAKPAAGGTYLAKVLWQSRKRGPKEPIETGIEILEAFDAKGFWGVTSPPDDWKNSVAGDAARRLEYLCARDRANPVDFALGPDGAEQVPSPTGPPVVPLPRVASGSTAEKDPWLADLMAAKEKIRSSGQPWTTRQAGQEAASGTQTRNEDSVVSPIHLTAEEVHTRLQATQQEMGGSLEANSSDYQQKLGELADAALETLDSKSQALLENFQARLEGTIESLERKDSQQVAEQLQKIAADLEEQSSRRLQSQADDTAKRWSEEIEVSGAVLVDEAKDQLANLTQVSLGSISQEAKAATEECRKQLAQSFEAQTATVSGATEVSVASVRRATEEAVAELQTTRQKAESSFEASASDYQRRLAELAASGLEGLESKSGALLEGFQGQLEKTLKGFEQKGAQQVADQLRKIAAGLQEQSSSQLEQQADATVQRLSEELQVSGAVLVDEAKDQLANLTQGSLTLLSKEAETTTAQCRSQLLQTFHDQSQAVSGDTEAAASSIRRAAEEAAAGFEATRLETEKTFRTDLAGCMEWLEDQAGAVLDGVHRKSDALLESFDGYRIQLDQSFQAQNESVSGSADTAVSSILSATREAAVDLQAIRQEMETNFKSSVGGYQKQLAELAASGLERLEQKSVALLESFQGQLQSTLEGFQQKGTREVADQLQKIATELQEQSTGQLQQQANDTVKCLSEELRVTGSLLLGNAREELLGLTEASLKSLAEEAQGITGSALEAAISVDRAADEAAAGLEAVRQQAEVSLESNVAVYRAQLAELAGEAAQGLERKSDVFLKSFDERSGQMAQAFLEKSATLKDTADAAANSIHQAAQQAATEFEAAHREMESRFELGSAEYEKCLTELVASGLKGLQSKSDSLLETLEEQRDQLNQTFGDQNASLSASADAAVNSVRLAAEEALAGWQVVRREMEIRSESGAADHQKRLTEVAASGLAGLELESKALLKDFEEKRSQLARTFEEQGRTVAGSTGAALVSIRQAAEESATEFLLIQQSAERSFEANAGAYHKRVADLAASGVEVLESKSEALLEAFQGELQKTLETSVEKGTAEATDQLLKVAEGLQQDSIRQLREQADDTVKRLTDQLQASGAGLVDQSREQVSSVIQTSLDSLSQAAGAECRAQAAQALQEQAATAFQNAEAAATSIRLATQEAVAELQETRQETEAGLGLSVGEHQKRLAEMAGAELEGLQQKSNALLHSSKARLNDAIEGLQQKAASELKVVLQKIAADFEEQSVAHLRKQAAEVGATLRQDLQSSGLGVVEEARQLAGITKEALESLSQVAAEGCRQKLDEFAAKSAAMQKQMEGIASSNLDKVHKVIAPAKRATRFPLGFAVAALALVAIVPILIVAGVSSTTHPVMKLRAEAPAQFPGTSADWSPKRRASEEQVAKAYWQVALQELPAKFDYGMTLPEEPPAEFKVDSKNLPGGAKADPAARTRYWHKVRDAWASTQAWETSDLNADGIGRTLQEAAAKVRSKMPHLW